MRLSLLTHMLTVIIATSYVTLGIFATHVACGLWAPYAGVVLVLALLNLRLERNAYRSG